LLTSDNKTFQVTASYLLDLAQRAEQLFNESDEGLRQKLLEYVLSNIELKDKKLFYILNDPLEQSLRQRKRALRLIIQTFGAELQNLLKLFGALIDGSLSCPPNIPASFKSKELVIY